MSEAEDSRSDAEKELDQKIDEIKDDRPVPVGDSIVNAITSGQNLSEAQLLKYFATYDAKNLKVLANIKNPVAVTKLDFFRKVAQYCGFEICEMMCNAILDDYRQNTMAENSDRVHKIIDAVISLYELKREERQQIRSFFERGK